jgi:uncharacterized surface protein with fasciclin (FAS1) repeats
VQPVRSSFSIQPEPVKQQNVVAPVLVKNTPKTIADLVSTNPKFSTLLTAVKAAGLVDTLAGEGPFTVFAPTNTAFDKVRINMLTIGFLTLHRVTLLFLYKIVQTEIFLVAGSCG